MKIGFGFDAHAVDASRPLVIGGVTIPEGPGLAGHSDADVLCHAVADALLGAARLGDLGALFPNNDRWRGASSLAILSASATMLREERWRIGNVDATVVASEPKLSPYRDQMAERIAGAIDVDPNAVSVKATTTDGLGFTGRGEGMAAYAVVLISRVDS
jgi:2-C-methyl-D-erythritol 2,4-cyclodiphosphate synthase